jgi:hypothetical protein
LVHIFNLSLVQGTFPDIWKTAKTVPIHKGGNLAQIENYRPVALLSSFSKVFEIAIFNSLSSVWRSYLTPSQHGFLRGRFTVTNLVCVMQFISECLDRRGQVDMIYTDVAKAFDRVDHNILLKKLSECGFSMGGGSLFLTMDSLQVNILKGRGFPRVPQNDLETIDKWCRQNNFGLNIGKCSVVSFSRKIESLLTTLAKI